MVRALAGDSTITSVFGIPCSTLARTVNPYEAAAANSRNDALQFQLEQSRQQARCGEARSFRNLIEIARLAGDETREDRIVAPSPVRFGLVATDRRSRIVDAELFQHVVRGLHDSCAVAQERVRTAITSAQHVARHRKHVASLLERAAGRNQRPALLAGFDDDNRTR